MRAGSEPHVSLIESVRAAMASHGAEAHEAYALFTTYVDDAPRLPGMGTVERMAVRLASGRTVEEAAAREYVYRWSLPLGQWVNHAEQGRDSLGRRRSLPVTGAWPVPHAIGM